MSRLVITLYAPSESYAEANYLCSAFLGSTQLDFTLGEGYVSFINTWLDEANGGYYCPTGVGVLAYGYNPSDTAAIIFENAELYQSNQLTLNVYHYSSSLELHVGVALCLDDEHYIEGTEDLSSTPFQLLGAALENVPFADSGRSYTATIPLIWGEPEPTSFWINKVRTSEVVA